MKSYKILIVEDEKDIADLIAYHFHDAAFTTYIANNGDSALHYIRKVFPDLVMLDIMMPKIDGIEVIKILKKDTKTRDIPIVLLTAKGEEIDRVLGFELGAEDYVVKPFSPRELILRVKAILKRIHPESDQGKIISAGKIIIDTDSHSVTVDDIPLDLTPTEFNLLLYLVKERGKVLSRDKLLDLVWGYQFDGYARTVDTHIRRLRIKLGDQEDSIETIWGIGCRFKE